MNAVLPILPFNFVQAAENCKPNWNAWNAIQNEAVSRMLSYHPEYGHYLIYHLMRTSNNFENFLAHKGYDPNVAKTLAFAYSFHDIDKLAQSPSIHVPEAEKPSEDILAARKDHVFMDGLILKNIIDDLNIDLSEQDDEFYRVIKTFIKYHHERLDGSGPHALVENQMDECLQIGTIVDEVDGKAKLSKHTFETIFDDILGGRDKFQGKFNTLLAEEYKAFCIQDGLYSKSHLENVRTTPVVSSPLPLTL
jgi:hypothetical protein